MLKRIIIGPTYPLRGGISESNHALQSAFKEKGGVTKIVSYSLQYPSFLFPGKTQNMDDVKESADNTFKLINTLNPVSWIQTIRWIIKEKPDYIIVRYWHPYFAICLSFIISILKKQSFFIIGWIDNVNPHESIPFQHFLTSCFLKSCNTFMVMSNSVKNDIIKFHSVVEGKIHFHPHPIYNVFGNTIHKTVAKSNIGITEFNEINQGRYILFFGLIRKYKGLNLLLDVIASKKIKALNLKLIIAGEFYDSKEKYIQQINSLNINDRIRLYDFYIKNEDVANYFCAADIVVQPYISATQSGVSMVAYNFNKPILLTNVGGLSEYVEHKKNGYLVNSNIDDIALALEDFYTNNRESQFSNVIKNQKSDYTWTNLCNNFDMLYKKSKDV